MTLSYCTKAWTVLLFVSINWVAPAYSETKEPFFPIWGKEARAKGYILPKTYGIGLNYMTMKQDISVDSIQFSGLGVDFLWVSLNLPSHLFQINVKDTHQKSHSSNLRLDMWVLPFLNVYGILGKTTGNTVSKVSVDSTPSEHSGINQIISGVIHYLNQNETLKDLDFVLRFKGMTYGGGITLVAGVGNWFSIFDTNYTLTSFDILSGEISALTFAPRFGYRFNTFGVDKWNLKSGKLNVWLGGMYQDIQQEFNGRLSDLSLPSELRSLISIANQRGGAEFTVKQHLSSPWNLLSGARYEITPNFALTAEVGFGQRKSYFVSGEYRF